MMIQTKPPYKTLFNTSLFAFLGLLFLATCLSEFWWPLELANHLRPQLCLLALSVSGWFWWQRCHKRAVISVCMMVTLGWPVWQWAMVLPQPQKRLQQPVKAAKSNGQDLEPLTVMTWNFYRYNPKPDQVIETLLHHQEVEVLYLTEVTQAWMELLKPIARHYPHQLGPTDYGNWLLSKHPLQQTSMEVMTYEKVKQLNFHANQVGEGLPHLQVDEKEWWENEVLFATVNLGAKRVRVGGIHPPTPVSAARTWGQRVQAWYYREKLNEDPTVDAKILMGDFNTSPFSMAFARIKKITGLCPIGQGRGFSPTWGLRLPREPLLPWGGVQIDHIMVSDALAVEHFQTGLGRDGADHRWIKASLWLMEEN